MVGPLRYVLLQPVLQGLNKGVSEMWLQDSSSAHGVIDSSLVVDPLHYVLQPLL